MIRIFTTNEPSLIKITIDGKLLRDFVDVLAGSIDGAMAEGLPVHLFLRDVPLIDDHGRTLLATLARRGVELSARGVYSSYIVGEVRREAGERDNGGSPAGLARSNISEDQRRRRRRRSKFRVLLKRNGREPECGLYGV